ncbi:hypothetical protein [Pseudomonas sp. ADAK18]|nr:hypothetical protein [Pseudomonas sp. ADAK18]
MPVIVDGSGMAYAASLALDSCGGRAFPVRFKMVFLEGWPKS